MTYARHVMEKVDTRGFFEVLFDFGFRHFIAVRLAGVIYGLLLAVGALYALIWIVGAFQVSVLYGLLTLLVLAPLGFILYAMIARVYLEIVIALVRVAENTGEILTLLRQKANPEA